MNGLYLQYEELSKNGKKVNVLCFADQYHWRSVVAVYHSMVVINHSRNFKGIEKMVNPCLNGYNIEN